jgi:hypothetical protein
MAYSVCNGVANRIHRDIRDCPTGEQAFKSVRRRQQEWKFATDIRLALATARSGPQGAIPEGHCVLRELASRQSLQLDPLSP